MHLGGLLSTQEARVDSCASFVLSNLLRASITPWLPLHVYHFLNIIPYLSSIQIIGRLFLNYSKECNLFEKRLCFKPKYIHFVYSFEAYVAFSSCLRREDQFFSSHKEHEDMPLHGK